MKKNELITLGVGIVIIVFLAWIGGAFSLFSTHTNSTTVMSKQGTSLPEVIGKNVSNDPKIQIIEVQQGSGAVSKNGSKVAVNYTGMLEDGTKFDSSYTRGTPIEFTLGAGEVIKGWDVGIAGMKIGGKRRLIINPEYAYGSAGAGGVIPPNATLVFDVELVGVK
jgi:peptidylprolyl isomerase